MLSRSTNCTISDDIVFDVEKNKNGYTHFINEESVVFRSTISEVTIESFTSFTQCGVGSYQNIFSIAFGITLYTISLSSYHHKAERSFS